ncbi:MAG TPA: alpha/beta fold hydrolase [Nannocystis exedens]|nr:alpha/beta fold hydrolase [Nannocystis exedens]
MASISINDCDIYYEDSGGRGRPVVVLSHGLLWSTALFRAQVEGLRDRYRVICYDHRGQGRSSGQRGRSIPIETCYRDAAALIQALGVGPCHFGGLSMGGFVAIRLAIRRPDLLLSCALIATNADAESRANLRSYRRLNRIVRWFGIRPVADQVMPIMFGESFMRDPLRAAERAHWRAQLVTNRRSIHRAVNGAIERAGVSHDLQKIRTPTLIIGADEDIAITLDGSRRLHAAIPRSKLVVIEGVGHLSTVEAPQAVTTTLRDFLDTVEANRATARGSSGSMTITDARPTGILS